MFSRLWCTLGHSWGIGPLATAGCWLADQAPGAGYMAELVQL